MFYNRSRVFFNFREFLAQQKIGFVFGGNPYSFCIKKILPKKNYSSPCGGGRGPSRAAPAP